MANQQLFDRFTTTVSSSYTAGGGSLVITSATGLPSGGNYYLIVQAEGANTEEVFLVTARSSTTLTVTGAQWGTSASNHASTAVIIAPIVGSDVFRGITQDILMRGTRANLPASGPPASRAIYKCSDSPYEFFWDGSAWQAAVFGLAVTEPAIGSFTAVNSPTTVTTFGGIKLTSAAHSGASWRMMSIAVPATPYTIVAAFLPSIVTENFHVAGIGWRESSSGKIITFGRNNSGVMSVDKWTDPNTYSATYTTESLPAYGPIHLIRIQEDASNRTCSYSFDLGKTWYQVHQVGRTDFITADQLIFGADSETTANATDIWLLGWDVS